MFSMVLQMVSKSPLSLLCSNIGISNRDNLSSYSRSASAGANLVAALCILSSFLLFFLVLGYYTVAAYSSFGLIIVTNIFFTISSSIYVNATLIDLSQLQVSPMILFICLSGDIFFATSTPRSFSTSTFFTSLSPSFYNPCILFLLFPNSIMLHFFMLSSISHFWPHFQIF